MIRLDTSNRKLTRGLILITIALLVIALDQLTKHLVKSYMEFGQSIPGEGFLRLTYTTNTGGAFGILANQTFLLAMAALIGITVLLIYLRYLPLDSTLLKMGLGLDLGGAVGNLIDRLRSGEVTDFIKIGPWPVFNLADSSIVIGTILIIYYLLFSAKTKPQDKLQK